MWEYGYTDELYHYGVKGMKWGVRKARGHAGPGRYIGNKRKLAGYKRDLETLDKGGHLSVGVGKKRQAKFDARDRKTLEKRISKLEMKTSVDQSRKDIADAKANYKQSKKDANPNRKREIAIAVGSAAGTALAAYGVYKVTQAVKDSKFKRSMKDGMDYLKHMESKGRFDAGFEELQMSMSDWYGASTSKVIKNMIDGNTRGNGQVDWKGVVKSYKKGASIKL